MIAGGVGASFLGGGVMKVFLGSLIILASAFAIAKPTPLGPHPFPAPGAVVEEFPENVHCWHNRGGADGDNPSEDLHAASHIVVKGPDGLWLDGTVHVGQHVGFLADHPARLPDGTYKVWSVARWADGAATDEFGWEFSVKKGKGQAK